MRIAELFGGPEPVFSFEFFPPKTDAGYRSLYRTIGELKRLDPGFVSVTCGAAGATRAKTTDLVIRIQQEIGLTAMAHMVCTGSRREELAETLGRMQREGLENVLALPPSSASASTSASAARATPRSTPRPRASRKTSRTCAARSMPGSSSW
jgi:methylenetetrahydrofolate reductase (NADPH)